MPGFTTIVAPVRDLTAAKAIYTALLGVEPHTDEDFYVGYNVDGCEFGLNPAGFDQGETGPLALVDVDDVRATIETLVAAGAEVVSEPADVGGGAKIAVLADADGNRFGLRSMG